MPSGHATSIPEDLALYVDLFASLPFPTTLIDRRGIILDLNQAFLEHARRYVGDITGEDRLGHHVLDFVAPEEKSRFSSFLDGMLEEGLKTTLFYGTSITRTGQPLQVRIHGLPLKEDSGKVIGGAILRQDATEEWRQQQRQTVLARLLREVWNMERSQDIEQVLSSIYGGLIQLGVSFDACGLSLIDADVDPPGVRCCNITHEGKWIEETTEPESIAALLHIWREGKEVYRRDLRAEDSFDEGKSLAEAFANPVRSVVDVPFSNGTLALNSARPDAFSSDDIAILREMASILSSGFARFSDFEKLEERTRELETEVADRWHRETCQLALARVRDAIWSMDGVGQIVQLLDSIKAALDLVGISYASCGINIVDTEREEPVVRFFNLGEERWNEFTFGDSRRILLEIWQRGEPVYRRDLHAEDSFGERLHADEFYRTSVRSVVDIPFSQGTLAVNSTEPDAFSEQDILFLKELADVVGEGVRRLHDLESLERQARTAESLATSIAAVAASHRLEEVLEIVAREASRLVEAGRAALFLFDETLGLLIPQAQIGHHQEPFGQLRLQPGEGTSGQAFASGQVFISGQTDASGAYKVLPQQSMNPENRALYERSLKKKPAGYGAAVPLLRDDHPMGALSVGEREHPYDARSLELLRRLAEQAVLAIERWNREEELQVNLALQRIRNEILRMRSKEDWDSIAACFSDELSRLIDFRNCGFTLVDLDRESYIAHRTTTGREQRFSSERLPDSLRQALESGSYVYRRNRGDLLRFGDRTDQEICSAVDVPFRGGTVYIESIREDAFTGRDIRILEQFSSVMSEGYRRLEDIEKLQAQEQQLLQSQKMEIVGRLAGGVAHDFNNMLTAILGTSEHLLQESPPGTSQHSELELIQTAGQQAASITQQLLAFSRQQRLQPQILDLNEQIGGHVKMIQRLIGEDVTLVTRLSPQPGQVEVDPVQFEQVLLNLVVNARDAMPRGGHLTIETREIDFEAPHTFTEGVHAPQDIPAGSYVRLSVSDTGEGIEAESLIHIFEPFFTTKERGKGTGLGLSTVYGIVTQSKGHIAVYSQPDQGATFEIYLPRVQATPAAARGPEIRSLPHGSETILVAEDDDLVRRITRRILLSAGYRVLDAPNGHQALKTSADCTEPIHLLLTDVIMPSLNGRQLADRLRAARPNIRVIYMSGHADDVVIQHEILAPGIPFLQKPFDVSSLLKKVREVLDGD